jgi:hypothetical protein
MEPVSMEMNLNASIAIAFVIAMIGFLSWGLVKNFEDNLHVNSGMHTKEEVFPATEATTEAVEDLDNSATEEEVLTKSDEETKVAEELNDEINAWKQVPEATEWSDMIIDTDDSPRPEDIVKQIRTDIDSLHEHVDELGHNIEVTHNLVTQISASAVSMNDNTVETLSQKIHTLQTSLAKEFKVLTDTQSALSESLTESKLTIGSLLAKSTHEYVTPSSLMTYATLDSMNFMKKMMLDEFRMTLADYVPLRELTALKTQLDEFKKNSTDNSLKTQLDDFARRTATQKTVYQAWNGSAEWSDFNEGKLNIQMIRKKFATAEQNEEWLLPENKKIAAYNRDQLLGLDDQSWETKDNQIFVKRYYKDDWDASIEVAITVTLSKKIMVPPGGKPEVTMSHILRKLSESEKIQWEHLLVNV